MGGLVTPTPPRLPIHGEFKADAENLTRLAVNAHGMPAMQGNNDLANPAAVQMAVALNGRPVYAGTVDPEVKAMRRRRNKAARRARRVHRR